MRRKTTIIMIFVLIIVLIIAAVFGFIYLFPKSDKKTAKDELFVKELLSGKSVDEVADSPEWKKEKIDFTSEYLTVSADRFDFSKEIEIEDGITYLYFAPEDRIINMLLHNYVLYTNGKDPKSEIENIVTKLQGNVAKAIGNPTQAFRLINTSGEFKDYGDISLQEMTEKVIEGKTAIYAMYENNGLRYEINIMFSDNTVYTMVWVYREDSVKEIR